MLTVISISVPPPCHSSSMHVKYPGHSAEVAVLGSPSLIVLMVSVDYLTLNIELGTACRGLPQGWLLVVDDL